MLSRSGFWSLALGLICGSQARSDLGILFRFGFIELKGPATRAVAGDGATLSPLYKRDEGRQDRMEELI
jgi:hypothetical protein